MNPTQKKKKKKRDKGKNKDKNNSSITRPENLVTFSPSDNDLWN